MFKPGKTFILKVAAMAGLFTAPIFGAIPKKISESCKVVNASAKKGQPKQSCTIVPNGAHGFTVKVKKNLVRDEDGTIGSKVRIGSNLYPFQLKAAAARQKDCKQMDLAMNFALVPDPTDPKQRRAKLQSLNSTPICSAPPKGRSKNKASLAASMLISMNDSGNWKTAFFKIPPPAERAVATRTLRLVLGGEKRNESSGESSIGYSQSSSSRSGAPSASVDSVPARTPTRADSLGMADDEEEEDEDDAAPFAPNGGNSFAGAGAESQAGYADAANAQFAQSGNTAPSAGMAGDAAHAGADADAGNPFPTTPPPGGPSAVGTP